MRSSRRIGSYRLKNAESEISPVSVWRRARLCADMCSPVHRHTASADLDDERIKHAHENSWLVGSFPDFGASSHLRAISLRRRSARERVKTARSSYNGFREARVHAPHRRDDRRGFGRPRADAATVSTARRCRSAATAGHSTRPTAAANAARHRGTTDRSADTEGPGRPKRTVGSHDLLSGVSVGADDRVVRRGQRTALLRLRYDVALQRRRDLLPNAAGRKRNTRFPGAADAHVRDRAIQGRDHGLSARCDGEGLDLGRIAGISQSEARCSACAVSHRHHDRAAAGRYASESMKCRRLSAECWFIDPMPSAK